MKEQEIRDIVRNELTNLLKINNIPKELTFNHLKENIKTIDNVYLYLNRIKPTLENYTHLPIVKRERALNTQYIDDISELFNLGWKPDFTNSNQRKYYPWFERKSSGWVLGFVSAQCYYSCFGSGFYFEKEEVARFCANKFLSIYSKILE